VSREFTVSKPEHRMSVSHVVVGVVAEWTEGPEAFKHGVKVTIGGLFGAAKNLRSFEETGTELIEVEIDYTNGPRVPKSHGGVSGGALGELFVELDANLKTVKVNKRLHGVAFRQSNDHKSITSNAKPSIAAMIEKIREAWPDAANTA
jgi:hypothetical protein